MSSFAIKIIAIIAMTLDHFASIIGQGRILKLFPDAPLSVTYYIFSFANKFGRIAFPLFAFLIAEGMTKTRSKPRYIGRLLLFAIISEPIFFYAFEIIDRSVSGFFKSISNFHFENVFFTLALGALVICLCQLIEKRLPKLALPINILVVAVGSFIAEFLQCDYGIYGVSLIGAFYLAKTKRRQVIVAVVWAIWTYIIAYAGIGFYWSNVNIWTVITGIFAASSALFIYFYNGKRGRSMKYFFYIYYPAHILVFALGMQAIQSYAG